MDEAKTKSTIQAHAEAIARGDMDAAVADFCAEMQPHVPELAKALPLPVSSAEVQSVDVGDDESVALIRYKGDSGEVTIRSRWQDVDGRARIVAGEPVG